MRAPPPRARISTTRSDSRYSAKTEHCRRFRVRAVAAPARVRAVQLGLREAARERAAPEQAAAVERRAAAVARVATREAAENRALSSQRMARSFTSRVRRLRRPSYSKSRN